jgi:hypothetical protein
MFMNCVRVRSFKGAAMANFKVLFLHSLGGTPSAQRPDILTEVLRASAQSLQRNSRTTTISFRILSNSLLINHPVIRR